MPLNPVSPGSVDLVILGGGQLAQMLVEAAYRLRLRPVVVTTDPHSPASKVASTIPTLDDFTKSQVHPPLIFENEFEDLESLRSLQDRIVFVPSIKVMELLSDKAKQKIFLQNLSIPTAPFFSYESQMDIDKWLIDLFNHFPSVVLKWAKFGYDGKGVYIPNKGTVNAEIRAFVETAHRRAITVFAEAKVNFKRELCITSCRSFKGDLKFYPVVVSEQLHGICRKITGPADAFGLLTITEQTLQQFASQIANEIDFVGCFTLELFEMEDGTVLVNEIAPRVHNSAHVTQDSSYTSQFENACRAALGLTLGDTTSKVPYFAMVNIIGPEGTQLMEPVSPPQFTQGHLHWYSKNEIRARRKLGHVNVIANSKDELMDRLRKVEQSIQSWERKVVKLHGKTK